MHLDPFNLMKAFLTQVEVVKLQRRKFLRQDKNPIWTLWFIWLEWQVEQCNTSIKVFYIKQKSLKQRGTIPQGPTQMHRKSWNCRISLHWQKAFKGEIILLHESLALVALIHSPCHKENDIVVSVQNDTRGKNDVGKTICGRNCHLCI